MKIVMERLSTMRLLNKGTLIKIKFLSVIILMLMINGCSNELDVIFPEWGNNSLLANTTPLSDDMKSRFEGIYTVEQGNDQFGDQIII